MKPSCSLVDTPDLTFVGGFRSGSTLLINLLGLHPDVSTWYETKCLCEPLRWMKIVHGNASLAFETEVAAPAEGPRGFSAAAVAARMRMDMEQTAARISGHLNNGKAPHERYPLGADLVGYALEDAFNCAGLWQRDVERTGPEGLSCATGNLIESLSRLHRASLPGRCLVNKTPEIPRFGVELRACLGSSPTINLIRDGREVAASAASLLWGDFPQMAEFWLKLILESRAAADPEKYLEVRYEDLVSFPAATLNGICRFLKLEPLGSRIVASYEQQSGVSISPSSRVSSCTKHQLKQNLSDEVQKMLAELGYLKSVVN
ncbi:MAG: hypothetical protein C0614_05725 [Desulfuromonas sp.]|nr:MAG: hypothetical protein C0614_05725 [Desulfuromonas sp.]